MITTKTSLTTKSLNISRASKTALIGVAARCNWSTYYLWIASTSNWGVSHCYRNLSVVRWTFEFVASHRIRICICCGTCFNICASKAPTANRISIRVFRRCWQIVSLRSTVGITISWSNRAIIGERTCISIPVSYSVIGTFSCLV